MTHHHEPLGPGDLDALARHLDHVTTDLVDRLAITATDPWSRNSITGPAVQTQPRSRPPYNLNAGVILDTLATVLDETIRRICEHRGTPTPDLSTLVQMAGWLRKHRTALTTISDGPTLHHALCRAIDAAVRSVTCEEQEYRIPQIREKVMVATANQHEVDAGRIEKLAHKLGDQAKGLNRNRVDYLRRSGQLTGEWDEATGKWWYRLGDVLAAHKRARESRNAKTRA